MTNKNMLQIVIDGQVEIREDIKKLGKQINDVNEKLTERIDKLDLQLANLEDDAPTRDELEVVDEKVEKVAKHIGISV